MQYFNSLFISERVTSEEWIICVPGAYLPDVYEEVNSLAQIFRGIFQIKFSNKVTVYYKKWLIIESLVDSIQAWMQEIK